MLRPGGRFVHNDGREIVIATARSLGLAAEGCRTLLVATGEPPLYDSACTHRKTK